MKNLNTWSVTLFLMMAACVEAGTEPEIIIDPTESFVEGEWELYKSEGSMVNIVLEGEDLKREQVYTFTNEGSFTKYTQDEQYEAGNSGSYELEEVPEYLEENYVGVIVLTFISGDGYANNCLAEEKEFLHISKEGELHNISAAPCDGPYLYYQKLED